MTPPTIGITGPDEDAWIARKLTARALDHAGARPVQLAPSERHELGQFDGFVIGGGRDVDPQLYGGKRDPKRLYDFARDEFELQVLAHAEANELPLLGICRGAQLWNVARGGKLHPDVSMRRGRGGKRRRLRANWKVAVSGGSRLAQALGETGLRVNRLHSQAIDEVGAKLTIVARDSFDIPQAIESASGALRVGVQWHPELLPFSNVQQRLWHALVEASAS